MMAPGKGTLLLLVLAMVICVGCVSGTAASCTKAQKDSVLVLCNGSIKKGKSDPLSKKSMCCKYVRNIDTICIVSLLTDKEKKQYNEYKIRNLRKDCSLAPSAALDLVTV
ncbi:hypothetical protein SORBI_3005G212000 [Sorghum bicolor]|uniref:Bifunctional inhibitor/plant lipid transfer protein/seed storage helical domain-containing protein n=1 Tax=Sorghum bicolor TaxID=4558 RepID=C5Y7K4_SORBI|nr:hypothetical protein SORBI_3005G212000 [Sorghum bicolor]